MSDAKLLQSILKKRFFILFACGKAVGELKAIVSLYTLHFYTAALIPFYETLCKISRRIGALFLIAIQKSYSGIFVYCRVLIQLHIRIRQTAPWNYFNVNLYAFSGTGHLLVELRFMFLFFGLFGQQTKFFS